MECIFIKLLPTTKEYFYKNASGETETVNIHICNSHNSAVTVTIACANKIGSTGIPLVNESMDSGDRISLTNVALNDQMFIYGVAGTADVVGVKVDRV